MKNLLLLFIAVFLRCKESIKAQDLNFPGLAPSVSLTVHQKKFDFNFLVASKIREGSHTIKGIAYEPRFLEIYSQALISKKLNDRWFIAGGYGFQRNNPFRNDWRNEHRLVQQVMNSRHF